MADIKVITRHGRYLIACDSFQPPSRKGNKLWLEKEN